MSAWAPSTDFLEGGGAEGLCPRGGRFDYSTELRLEHLWVVAQARGPVGNECPSVGWNRAGVSSSWLWSAERLTKAELKPKKRPPLCSLSPGGGERGAKATSQQRASGAAGLGRSGPDGAAKEMRG